jgi:starvation-inducible DNA-binding protein
VKTTLFDTANSLTPDTRQKVAALLNQTLADLSDLYSQTKQAHWNVRGPSFYSLHKLFDELAGMVEGHIDPVAERITALGGIAQGTVRQAASHSALSEFPAKQPEELSYVTALVERFGQCATAVRRGVDKTAALSDAGTADLLTGLSQDLDKALWFLEAHSRR